MKILKLTVLSAVVACALVTAGARQLDAQQAQLSHIGNMLSADGFQATHDRRNGFLDHGASTTFSVWLEQGTWYVVRGTCDGDCSDLDLELRRHGDTVAGDYATDDVPEVRVRPRRAGWYEVRVIMAECSRQPCGYAVGTFGR
jgi:hypothetical protein